MPKRKTSETQKKTVPKEAGESPVKQKIAKAKKTKKEKDPNAPKRPKSAFLYFCGDKREEVKSQNPESKLCDVTKKLGELYKVLQPDEKKKYEAMAADDKKRYETEKLAYSKEE